MQRLREDFEVRVHNQPLTRGTLAGVKLLLIANPSDRAVGTNAPPPHVSPADIAALTEFVHQGGGLILMENQENHNLEVEDSNKLLAQFGIQATNLYTDAKKLVLPKRHPLSVVAVGILHGKFASARRETSCETARPGNK